MQIPWMTKKKKKCWRPTPTQIAVTAGVIGAFGVGVWVGYKALKPLMARLGCCCDNGDEEVAADQ